jgi:hypothetical protein
MPVFQIEQYELHTQTHRVVAENEAQAIAKVFNGEAEPVDGSLEYIEVADDFGLPAEKHRGLADELRGLGVSVGEVIPSIRSVVKIE